MNNEHKIEKIYEILNKESIKSSNLYDNKPVWKDLSFKIEKPISPHKDTKQPSNKK
ncbi:hypothetical protein SFB54_03305 [Legionella pneumophila subsp. fraseri]|nr:hypothetical protein [Legionella pneumophila subsp. fraseri]HAT1795195.1 hypothetical protein [Legionella pneumophila]MDW8962019.1 hypothetical protein [Legionella pneumophila subsp. fraseri]MDW9036972.1 hypothetical protein [Legionella pneumophila subsp. fraseri]MDW9038833.1 hypothetical protein [Legionella pneumophila subsp. fraseri]